MAAVETSQTLVSAVEMSYAIVPARFENVVSKAYVVPSLPSGHKPRYLDRNSKSYSIEINNSVAIDQYEIMRRYLHYTHW